MGDKMLKKLNIIHLILLIIDVLVIPVIGFIHGFETPTTFITVLVTVLLAHPLIYLIMMVIKEAKILTYDTPRFMPLCMVLTILLGCVIWYAFFHIEHVFERRRMLWYSLVLLAFAIPNVLVNILDRVVKNKKDDNKPKIIRNK
jgi:hypothetical protein